MLLTICIDAFSCPVHPSLPADTLFFLVFAEESELQEKNIG